MMHEAMSVGKSRAVVQAGSVSVGGGGFCVAAGPCAVESREQIISAAMKVKSAGADVLRGGAFKPRTSPYSFQGLGKEALDWLLEAGRLSGLPVVSELTDIGHLELFADVDVIQVGARNMQNFELLRELGHTRKPILLKRGLANTLRELLLSAEYIMSGGNERIILCERGIRTFETATRYTLDLSAVPVLRAETRLPVIVDPSHATGRAALVPSMALAAAASGADGVLLEVHPDPANALCDGTQALTPEEFAGLLPRLRAVRAAAQ